jgi:hypothetical protein
MSSGTVHALATRTTRRIWPAEIDRSGRFPDAAQRMLSIGIGVAVAGVALQTITHLAVFRSTIGLFNADDEGSLWNWAGAGATLAAAVALLVLIALRPVGALPLGALAAITTFMSLDDGIALHERAVHKHVHSLGPIQEGARVIWPVFYLPLLAAAFVLIWTLGAVIPRPSGRLLRIGLFMLVAAVAAEEIAAVIVQEGQGHLSIAYNLEVVVEEGLELAGWLVIATGVLATAIAWAFEDARRMD